MTKSEYFEKNNISFAEAMREFNVQKKFKSFDKFLRSVHFEWKFKVGDLVVMQLTEDTRFLNWKHSVVFEVRECNDYYLGSGPIYTLKFLTPHDRHWHIGETISFSKSLVEKNFIKY